MPTSTPPSFYIAAPVPRNDVYAQIKLAVTPQNCTRTLAPIVIGAQVYDLVNTARAMGASPTRTEGDTWNRMFAGSSHRSVVGIAIGMAVLDTIKMRLTQHSAVLRCAAMAQQLSTNIKAIITTNTNGRKP